MGDPVDVSVSSILGPLRDPLIGGPLGPCDILEVLGAGGMGVVYKARDRNLNRIVALKVLARVNAANKQFIARFKREATVATSLTHPGVVAIYNVGQAGATHFIEMEYVDGGNLTGLIRREAPMPPARAMPIFLDITRTVEYAHARKIIHRDLKPDNVLLSREGVVKIADFGLAKCLADDQFLSSGITISGTPVYMAPERFDGVRDDLRSDLYALGVVFYLMLTAQCPCTGKNVVEIMRSHKEQVPPPVEHFNPSVPAGLSRVIMSLLEKKPERRIQSAAELLDALSRVPLSPAASSTEPELIRLIGNGATERLPLTTGIVTIGRLMTSSIRLDDPKVSGEHARLSVRGGAVTIEDAHSRNGTRVNGRRVTSAALCRLDIIAVGDATFLFLCPRPFEAPLPRHRAYVTPATGPTSGRIYPLDASPLLIGGTDADIRLHGKDVSSFHARIAFGMNRFQVTDLHSRSGTWVGTTPVRRAPLRDGESFRVGSTVFSVRLGGQSAQQPTVISPPPGVGPTPA